METYLLTDIVHCVKISPKNFEDVVSERLSFQIRKSERDYKLGDFMYLQEFDGVFTGKAVPVKINNILREDSGLQDGYVLLNIEILELLIRDNKKYPKIT